MGNKYLEEARQFAIIVVKEHNSDYLNGARLNFWPDLVHYKPNPNPSNPLQTYGTHKQKVES